MRLHLRTIAVPALICVALIVLTLTTGLLTHRVRQLRGTIGNFVAAERERTTAPLGTVIPAFTAYALDGTKVPVVFDGTRGSKMTLFFVYSPECPICDTTWPQWNQVRQAADISTTRQVFVDLTGTTTATYLNRWALSSSQIITHVSPVATLRLRISVTPQLILANEKGEVAAVWTGRLKEAQLDEVIRTLRNGGTLSSSRP